VVHRDLKPSNILVTADGIPKLLDFGIARLIEPNGPGDRTQTVYQALTPEYASPEQLRGLPVTTASDVYSLGVLLFELLTDERPWTMDDGPPPGPEDVFERPSARLLRRAAGSAPEARKALRQRARRLEGDLDTIVLMALRHEADRRYRSVDQMSDDVLRHLEARPVLARPDTLRYRAGKMIRRNPTASAAILLLALGLSAGVAATVWQASVARAERRRAEQRFDEVRRLAGALVFELHDAIKDLPGSTRARALVLDRARQHLDSLAAGSNDPSLQRELAAAYLKLGSLQGSSRDANLGQTTAALASYRKALELQERALLAAPADVTALRERANIEFALGSLLRDRGSAAEADALERRAIQTINDLVRAHPEDVTLKSDLASAYERIGFNSMSNLEAALAAHRRSLALCQEIAAARPEEQQYQRRLAAAHKHVGAVLIVQKLLDEALAQYQAALAIEERTQDPHDARAAFDASFTHSDIGYIHWQKGDRKAALQSYHRALELREGVAAKDPSDKRARGGVARTLGYIGAILLDDGQTEASIAILQRSTKLLEDLHAADPANLRVAFDLANKRFDLARAQMALARNSATPAPRKTVAWTEATRLLELAQPVYADEQKRGGLVGNMKNAMQELNAALAESRAHVR
jgi:non-specific serine/threonine protein kinase/serine/threonine-protein kinase